MKDPMCANCMFSRPANRPGRVTCRVEAPVFLRGGSVDAGWPEVGAEEWCRHFTWPEHWETPIPPPPEAESA